MGLCCYLLASTTPKANSTPLLSAHSFAFLRGLALPWPLFPRDFSRLQVNSMFPPSGLHCHLHLPLDSSHPSQFMCMTEGIWLSLLICPAQPCQWLQNCSWSAHDLRSCDPPRSVGGMGAWASNGWGLGVWCTQVCKVVHLAPGVLKVLRSLTEWHSEILISHHRPFSWPLHFVFTFLEASSLRLPGPCSSSWPLFISWSGWTWDGVIVWSRPSAAPSTPHPAPQQTSHIKFQPQLCSPSQQTSCPGLCPGKVEGDYCCYHSLSTSKCLALCLVLYPLMNSSQFLLRWSPVQVKTPRFGWYDEVHPALSNSKSLAQEQSCCRELYHLSFLPSGISTGHTHLSPLLSVLQGELANS